MKTNLLTFIFLYNIFFVVSYDIITWASASAELDSDNGHNTESIELEPTTEDANKYTTETVLVDVSTSENPSITEHHIETTVAPNNCPKGQSSFSVQDINLIIDMIAEQLNIESNINSAYHQLAKDISNKLLKELDEALNKTLERPQHLKDVLGDIENNQKISIALLVKAANASLQQLPELENKLNKLRNETMKIEKDIEDIKELCRINKCPKNQMRSFQLAMVNAETDHKPQDSDDGHFCSNVSALNRTVVDKLSQFEANATEYFKQEVINKQKYLEKDISIFKRELKTEALSMFGQIMYDTLSLMDDQFHIEEPLKKFNKDSTVDSIKKQIAVIEYYLISLGPKIEEKRQACRTCQQIRWRGYFMFSSDDMNENKVKINTENGINLLDQLVDSKINEIKKKAQADVEAIFESISSSMADESAVRKIIKINVDSTKPIRDEVIERLDQAKEVLETLLKSASEESREHAREVLDQAKNLKELLKKIDDQIK